MPETFDIEFCGDYISVKLGADYEVSHRQEEEFWGAIEAACKVHDCHSVLLEGYVPKGQPEAAEVVQAGLRAAEVTPRLWFALCLENHEPSELGELFKAVARSRGVHVKFFTDRGHALLWLRSGTADERPNP